MPGTIKGIGVSEKNSDGKDDEWKKDLSTRSYGMFSIALQWTYLGALTGNGLSIVDSPKKSEPAQRPVHFS
jgi:hypothetical protein